MKVSCLNKNWSSVSCLFLLYHETMIECIMIQIVAKQIFKISNWIQICSLTVSKTNWKSNNYWINLLINNETLLRKFYHNTNHNNKQTKRILIFHSSKHGLHNIHCRGWKIYMKYRLPTPFVLCFFFALYIFYFIYQG